MVRRLNCVLLMAALLAVAPCASGGQSAAATSQQAAAWQKEFDDVCSQTQDAMTFSTQQLEGLVARCDALASHIGRLDETQKKVYTVRLRMCRGLYAYVLESKRNEKK